MTNEMTLPLGGQKKQWDPPKWMYPIIYNKWKILICIIAIVLIASLFAVGFAAEKGLGSTVRDMLKSLIEGEAVINWVKIDSSLTLTAIGETPGVTTVVDKGYELFQTVGTLLLLIYWSIGFFDMLSQSNNQIVLEQMIKKIILLIVGWAIVTHAKDIVGGILDGTNWLLDNFADTALSGSDSLVNTFMTAINNQAGTNLIVSQIVYLGWVCKLLLPWAVGALANTGVKVYAMARYLEICIVTVLSPVMFADFSNSSANFTHSGSFRAMKYIAALALQGIIIVIGVNVCGNLAGTCLNDWTVDNFFTKVFAFIAILLARFGIAAKSQQIARQAVGLG